MKLTIATYEETEQRLKNEPFRVVTPMNSKKYTEQRRKNKEKSSQKEAKKRE
jgi:hypothetical protein